MQKYMLMLMVVCAALALAGCQKKSAAPPNGSSGGGAQSSATQTGAPVATTPYRSFNPYYIDIPDTWSYATWGKTTSTVDFIATPRNVSDQEVSLTVNYKPLEPGAPAEPQAAHQDLVKKKLAKLNDSGTTLKEESTAPFTGKTAGYKTGFTFTTEDGTYKVVYFTFMLGDHVVDFWCRAKTEQFDTNAPAFEQMAGSLRPY